MAIKYWYLRMKFREWLVGLFVFLLLLAVIYIIHAKFFEVNVVFYSAIFDGVLASVITGIILWKVKYFNCFSVFEKSQMVFIYVLLGYIYAISVPTVIDRSLSFYILEKLEERGGGIKESAFKEIFTNEYVPEYRLVDVRLTEQLQSGTITIHNGCVKLTKRGYFLADVSSFIRKNFLPKKRLLMGKYTDVLTDPLGYSKVDKNKIDYLCK